MVFAGAIRDSKISTRAIEISLCDNIYFVWDVVSSVWAGASSVHGLSASVQAVVVTVGGSYGCLAGFVGSW